MTYLWKQAAAISMAMLLLGAAPLRAAEIRIVHRADDKDVWSVIQLSGRIERGDSERLAAARRALPEREFFSFIRLMLDSPGGDYVEALRLGWYVQDQLISTRVGAGKSCIGPCAFVYMGGGEWANGSGWTAQHELEPGGQLAFEGLTRNATMADGSGRTGTGDSLIGGIYAYLQSVHADPQLFPSLLALKPGERMPITRAGQLRMLQVQILGLPQPREVTDRALVNLCNWATGWRRPLTFAPDDPQAPKAEVTPLSYDDFKRRLLLGTLNGMEKDGPLAAHIREVAENGDSAALDALYSEATDLHILRLHSPRKSGRFYYVSGFDFGGGFYTASCSIALELPDKSNGPLGADIVEGELVDDIPGRVHSFRAMGDVLYELYEPNQLLLP
jgi:hypothetical protein